MKDVAAALSKPFPAAVVQRDPRGLSYVPVAEVVARMNDVVGLGNWSVEVLNTEAWGAVETYAGPAPAHIVALVRVTVLDPETGDRTFMDAFGGQDVGYFKDKMKGPLNLGDAYKGACSDAMKKALQHMGVALDLARRDEAIAATAPPPAPACRKCGEILPDAEVETLRLHMVASHGYVRLPDGKVAPDGDVPLVPTRDRS